MKHIKVVLPLLIISIIILSGCKIQTPEDYYNNDLGSIYEGSDSVYLSINCFEVVNNLDTLDEGLSEYVPDDGIILEKNVYLLNEGDTVLELLIRVTKHYQIHLDVLETTAIGTAYVKGINHLYEFDCGPMSGWTYYVNGEMPGVGCGDYILKSGDIIEWKYSIEE